MSYFFYVILLAFNHNFDLRHIFDLCCNFNFLSHKNVFVCHFLSYVASKAMRLLARNYLTPVMIMKISSR